MQEKVKINFKLNPKLAGLSEEEKKKFIPKYSHPTDVGMDLIAIEDGFILPNCMSKVDTSVIFDLPEGYAGFIFPRSGNAAKKEITLQNAVGVADPHYVGNWMVLLRNEGKEMFTYLKGDRIAQLVVMPFPKVELEEVSEFEKSDRGEGGFGSTGN